MCMYIYIYIYIYIYNRRGGELRLKAPVERLVVDEAGPAPDISLSIYVYIYI